MRLQSSGLIALLIFGVLIGAESLAFAQTPDPQTGTIVDIQPRQPTGKLKVKQKGGGPADATVGMPVRRGYLLTLASGAGATVVCADNSKHELETGPQACPCVANNVIEDGSGIPRPRGADTRDSSFPVIIAPRVTSLLTGRPALRWSAVLKTGTAPKYRVRVVTDDEVLVWERAGIQSTSMPYPADEPELAPGYYLLVVSTPSGSSTKERGVDLGFTVLPRCPSQASQDVGSPCQEKIREGEKRIRALRLPDDSTHLLIANLYAANRLYAEATAELEAISATARTPAVARRLGDSYASVGLNREAEKLYLEALSLPEMAKDTEARALTLRSLALTYEGLLDWDQARARYEEAISAYEKLRDHITLKELKAQRARIEGLKH